jgi:hypothetical protein
MPRSSSIPATLSETVQSRFLFSKNPAHGPLAAFNKRSPPKKYGAEIPLLRTSRVDNQKKEGLWRGGRKVYVEDVENDHLHLQSNSGARMPKGVLDRIL